MPLSKYKKSKRKTTTRKRRTTRKGDLTLKRKKAYQKSKRKTKSKSKKKTRVTKHKPASRRSGCKICGRKHTKNEHRFHAKGKPRLPKVKRN